jgi:hypothetical protein
MKNELFSIIRYDSFSELCASLKVEESVVITDPNDGYDTFIAIQFKDYTPIPVAFHYLGSMPQLYTRDHTTQIFIGFDQVLVSIDYSTGEKILQAEFDTPLYEYIVLETQQTIVVVCEMDSYILDFNGVQIRTSGYPDSVNEYEIRGDYLYIQTEEGIEASLSILN